VNDVGKPCDREGHARLDGEGLETGASKLPAPALHLQVLNMLNKVLKSEQPNMKAKGGRLSDERPRAIAPFLRFSSRTLAPHSHDEPD
jgi:hypothetical protein